MMEKAKACRRTGCFGRVAVWKAGLEENRKNKDKKKENNQKS